MITIKYKGEVINPNDIEITWKEYGVLSDSDICVRTGNIEDYTQSKYSDGYDEGYNEGYEMGYDDGVAHQNA